MNYIAGIKILENALKWKQSFLATNTFSTEVPLKESEESKQDHKQDHKEELESDLGKRKYDPNEFNIDDNDD